jgi:hypothetical protein
MPDRFHEVKARFLDSFVRSAGVNDYDVNDLAKSDVWLSGDACAPPADG